MGDAAVKLLGDDDIRLRRAGVRFPIELRPEGIRADDPTSWPAVDGRLELVDGRLLYMPPCADVQQYVAVDVAFALRSWSERHPGFLVGANEAGMKLGGDVRAADVAIWRQAEVGVPRGGLQQVPPVLAVEVAGQDEDESVLRLKARWYLDRGVQQVWLALPQSREVVVLTPEGEARYASGDRIAARPELPDLSPDVDHLFAQLG